MKVNVHLSFNGNCEEALRFYEECLSAKIVFMLKYGDSPMAGQTQPEWRDKVMHATLNVDGAIVMGADAPSGWNTKPAGFCVSISVDQAAEAERIFNALSAGGTVQMAMQETFWAQRFGMTTDRFGTPWMINCEKPMAT